MRTRHCLNVLLALVLIAAPQLRAQQVTGRVTSEGGQPIAAVQVFIAGSGIGALSQQNGRFLLLNVPVGTHTLTAERIGYRSISAQVTVAAGATVVQDFQMAEEALGLDEIIVTGTPGGTQRRAIGNSVVSVDAAAVSQRTVITNMNAMLQGRNPGVLMGSSGGIGTGGDISIRGYGSFNRDRAQPLVYVDGVRVNNESQAGPNLAGGRQSNVLNDFDPDDIESIEIIKGPAAATLYGSEASAGVIQIITKRGLDGSPEFTASLSEGRTFIRSPNNKMGTQWACTSRAALPCLVNPSAPPEQRELNEDAIVPYYWFPLMNRALREGGFNPEWDTEHWPNDNILQYGPGRSYNLGIRGGTERIRYFLSGNYDYNEGSEFWNWDKATRVRANVGVIFSDMFTLDASTAFTRGKTSYTGQAGQRGGLWDQVAWGQGFCAPYVSPNPDVGCRRNLGMQQFIPTDIPKVTSTRDYDRFTGSATLNFTTGSFLSSRAVFGLDAGWDTNNWIHPIETVQAPIITETREGQAVYERPQNTVMTVDWSATANYDVTDAFSTATSVGAQYFSKKDEMFAITGVGFASPLSTTINQTPIGRANLTYTYEENKSLGYYIQEQLGFNDRIFITGALRFDDNSTFGSSFDALIYPKVSGTWTLSDEAFWPLEFMESFRIRGAWGKAGQQPNTFASVNTYNAITGPGGTSALQRNTRGNPDVGPEVSTELELGFDASALEGRLSGEFSWYKTRSEDNLLGIAVAPSIGGGGDVDTNVGVIDKWGWEASISTQIYEGRKTAFSVDLNGAYTKNEIKELGAFPGNNTVKIGWTYPSHGQFGTDEQQQIVRAELDPAGTIVDPYGNRITAYCDAGILLDPDQTANPVTSQYGVVPGGAEIPCAQAAGYLITPGTAYSPYNFSIMPNLSLGGGALQINAKFDGAYGRVMGDRMKLWHHRYNTALGAVRQDDPLYYAVYRTNQAAKLAYTPGDFWKLREVGVRYQLPESFTSRIGADRASIGFSGRELLLLWWNGGGALGLDELSPEAMNMPASVSIDPEFGRGTLGDAGHRTIPPQTSFHVRLDVTF